MKHIRTEEFWVGAKVTCTHCKSRFKLEAKDKNRVEEDEPFGDPGIWFKCPDCKQSTFIDRCFF